MSCLSPRWDLALIPCTKRKDPTGITARTLYKSPGFTLMMKHASQRADRIIIMSAKYGLLAPTDPVENYEVYLPALCPEDRAALLQKIKSQEEPVLQANRILSYLPKAYHLALLEALPYAAQDISRPYRNLNMMTLFAVLRNEIDNYGKRPARR